MPLDYTVSYDPDTDIGAVRAAIQDFAVNEEAGDIIPAVDVPRNQWTTIFTDQEIQKKLDRHAGAVNQTDLAAADLLEDIASSAAQLAKLLRLGSYENDTRVTPSALRSQAQALRDRYGKALMSGLEEPAESITPEIYDDFGWRRSRFGGVVRG